MAAPTVTCDALVEPPADHHDLGRRVLGQRGRRSAASWSSTVHVVVGGQAAGELEVGGRAVEQDHARAREQLDRGLGERGLGVRPASRAGG